MRKDADAVVISRTNKCVKMDLPNGKVVDILDSVFEEIKKRIQKDGKETESGGYIVGYQHCKTGNVSLEAVSTPYPLDRFSRVHFSIRDSRHKKFLLNAQRYKSYYMGVWHTHPQEIPNPSITDWKDWNQSLKEDKTGCNYIFFIIAGTKEIRFWVGIFETNEIVEIFESEKTGEIYQRIVEDNMEETNEDEKS